jgi:ATP-dependent protease ClpP protease subunit
LTEELLIQKDGGKNNFRKVSGQLLEFYLVGPILGPEDYIEWFDAIRSAGPSDTVKIYINSPGGSVAAALQLMRVMGDTQAATVVSVEGECMSAATMPFMVADECEISPHSLFMFHNYSGGLFGKGGELFDQVQFERSWSKNLLHSIYKDFLTEAEVQQMLDNKDIWLTSEDVAERLKLRLEKEKQERAVEGDE